MNKSILIIVLCLFKISLLTDAPIYYRPMSKRSIDFGDDVCYYEDISNDFKLKYVKGCPNGKSCKLVGTTSDEYKIHTCQNIYSVSKRNSGETCDSGLYECTDPLTCTNKKCSSGTTVTPDPSACTTITKISGGTSNCITDQTELQEASNLCEVRDTETSTTTTYTHHSSTKTCLKIEIADKPNVEGKYIISKVHAEIYSIQDGEYVEEGKNEYCQSGFSLYFYEKGQLNPVGGELFKRCVTILAIEQISSSSDYLIKYKINDGEEHIYDTSKIADSTKKTRQNAELNDLLMVKLEIFKYLVEEYKKNGNSNGLKKWQYLYNNPNDYLLYKDQTDVLDYLIQQAPTFSDYIPEKYATNKDSQQITQESEATDTKDTTTQDETGFSRLLNIKYLSVLLFLFLL